MSSCPPSPFVTGFPGAYNESGKHLYVNPLIFGGAQVLTLWIQWIGIFADDPIFEEVTQGIEADRKRERAEARRLWAEDKTGV